MQIQIDIVSDVVCPWCFIGKRNLTRALELVPEIACAISWRPYQLDPTIPPGGLDRKTYMAQKFPDAGKRETVVASLMAAAGGAGLSFNLEAIARSPNTLDAHRLIHWARGQGLDSLMVERLMSAYFIDGLDIGDRVVLVQLAADVGMEADIIARLLAGDADRQTVEADIEKYRAMGVTGVPCFIFINSVAMMGAQPPEALAGAIRQVAAQLG